MLLEYARELRHSEDEYIRNHVFVNRDLTPAESQAAYEIRCRRRYAKSSNNSRTFYNRNRLNANAPVFSPITNETSASVQSSIVNNISADTVNTVHMAVDVGAGSVVADADAVADVNGNADQPFLQQ